MVVDDVVKVEHEVAVGVVEAEGFVPRDVKFEERDEGVIVQCDAAVRLVDDGM